jgi:ATP-dependent RNA helicase RhlE
MKDSAVLVRVKGTRILSNDLFQKLGVSQKFQAALDAANFVTPSKIQDQAIPALIEGRDVLGIAQTGTGKTAAFGLPLLQRLDTDDSPAEPKHPLALVLAPTRELAMQIHSELSQFARPTKLRLGCVYGGVGQNPQVKMLRNGVDILIATPGRLLDLIGQQHVKLGHVKLLVLDEADRLLDMGFIRDVKRIVAGTPRKRQSLLFSATMPDAVSELAAEMLHKPIRVEVERQQMTVEKIEQRVSFVATPDKLAAMEHILHQQDVKKAITFTRTKHGADKVARKLRSAGITAEAIHGNKSQNARNRALQAFKNGDAWVLVATDIAARGIDIDGVTHVINFELPHEPESYVHRIGRTGRAGASGSAWSLVDPSEVKRLRAVEKLIRQKIEVSKLDIETTVPVAQVAQVVQHRNDSQGDKGGKRRRPRRRKASRAAA